LSHYRSSSHICLNLCSIDDTIMSNEPSAMDALLKVQAGVHPLELSQEEMVKIERKHGSDWWEDLGLEDNPLYNSLEYSNRKTQW